MEPKDYLPVGVPLNKVQLIDDDDSCTTKITGYLFVKPNYPYRNLEILFRSKDNKNDPYPLYFYELIRVIVKKHQKQESEKYYDVPTDIDDENFDTINADISPWE